MQATGKTVVLLSHSLERRYQNPMGGDFDRFVSDCHEKTWGATKRWADAVLFGNFFTVLDEASGRAKGVGGTDRDLYGERRDAFDAKNRYGMPDQLTMPNDPGACWGVIWNAIIKETKS